MRSAAAASRDAGAQMRRQAVHHFLEIDPEARVEVVTVGVGVVRQRRNIAAVLEEHPRRHAAALAATHREDLDYELLVLRVSECQLPVQRGPVEDAPRLVHVEPRLRV